MIRNDFLAAESTANWDDIRDVIAAHSILRDEPDRYDLAQRLMGNILRLESDYQSAFQTGALPLHIAFVGTERLSLARFRKRVSDMFGWKISDIQNLQFGFVGFSADKVVNIMLLGYAILTVAAIIDLAKRADEGEIIGEQGRRLQQFKWMTRWRVLKCLWNLKIMICGTTWLTGCVSIRSSRISLICIF